MRQSHFELVELDYLTVMAQTGRPWTVKAAPSGSRQVHFASARKPWPDDSYAGYCHAGGGSGF
jgi:hypothetical protein